MKVQSEAKAAHAADCSWFPCVFPQQGDTSFPAHAQRESKRLRKLAGEEGHQAPSPPKRRLSDFPGQPSRRTSRCSQRLLLDVLDIVIQDHLLPDQACDGKQLDDLVLMPHGTLAALGSHLEEDSLSGHLSIRRQAISESDGAPHQARFCVVSARPSRCVLSYC